MRACKYAYAYVRMTHLRTPAHVHVYPHEGRLSSVHMNRHMLVPVRLHVRMQVRIHRNVLTRTRTHTRTCTPTFAHARTCVCVFSCEVAFPGAYAHARTDAHDA